ncbi:MAG: pseudouridylate synthase [Dysgonamonadaceae bacterium]|jgi:predicted hotdog family 3-hydroxylacyl-ACP dehydratase|nr:pseudouridylate synthase [Dysgonamonadaceae bacterium]
MDFLQINIGTLIPQKPPFVMVDRLLYSDSKATRTSLTVREDNIFCCDGQLTEPGLIENIAQTCAARMGYISSLTVSGAVKIGFIGAIRNQVFYRLPRVGETIETQIDVLQEIFQVTLVTARVYLGEEVITEGEMKISLTGMEV